MENYPLLTIFLLAHNGEKFIAKTLESLLGQTYPNFQIIVSDNYSDDKTPEIVRLFQEKDKRIIYRRNEKPSQKDQDAGCYYNYNTCISSELIKGEFVAFCHDNDIYEKSCLEKEVNLLIAHPEVGAVFTMANIIDQKGNIIKTLNLPKDLSRKKNIYNFKEIFQSLLKNGNVFLETPTFVTRPKVLREMGFFNGNDFETAGDLQMWLKIAEKYPVAIINEKLINWRTGGATIKYQRLQSARNDSFVALDYYLIDKHYRDSIDQKTLKQYDFRKYVDDALIATNFLIGGEKEKAREVIRKIKLHNIIATFSENITSRKVKGLFLIFSLKTGVALRLDGLLGKILNRIMYP